MNRRAFLGATAAGVVSAGGWVRYVEPTWFEVTWTRVSMPGIRRRRILHLSDFHTSDGLTAAELGKGMDAGLGQRPDLICLTGDFVSATTGFDRRGLEGLLRRAANAAPCYAVLGNHDGGAWLRRYTGDGSTAVLSDLIASTGVRLLHNQAVEEDGLTVIGVGDLWSGEFDPQSAFGGVSPSSPRLVLCHNPDAKQPLRRWQWDLMLSGHTHGGQGCIPGMTPSWTPVVDKRYFAGLYTWENRRLFITRGLGAPLHVRAFCRPEASILEVG